MSYWGKSEFVGINLYLRNSTVVSYELPEEVKTESRIKHFCKHQLTRNQSSQASRLVKINVVNKGFGNQTAQCTIAQLSPTMEDHDFCMVLQNYYIRNQKIYQRYDDDSLFDEWKISLKLFCTAFFKILSNEIRERNVPEYLRFRAIVSLFVAPTVALMGVLMPFASYYFNCILGDLDCWINGFDNHKLATLSAVERAQRTNRSFAIDLQPEAFLGKNPDADGNIDIYASNGSSCDLDSEDLRTTAIPRLVKIAFTQTRENKVDFFRNGAPMKGLPT